MALDLSRRGFLGGLGALLVAAPAIVRISSIMPVKALAPDKLAEIAEMLSQSNDLLESMPPPMTVWKGKVFMEGAWRSFEHKNASMYDPPKPPSGLIYRNRNSVIREA